MRTIITICSARIIHHMPGDMSTNDETALYICICIAIFLDLLDFVKTIKKVFL